MTTQPGSDYFELADYLGVLRRRWRIVLASTVAGIALAGAYCYVAPPTYAATVLVQVNALPMGANALGGRTSGPVNMDNESQIAQSATVAAIVKSELSSPLPVTGLLKDVKVAVPPNTTFLQVTCSASTGDQAARCANAFGRAYLYNRRATALDLITSDIKALEAQAATVERGIEQLRAKVGRHGLPQGSTTRGVAELQLQAKLTRLTTIQNKINSATPLEANLSARNTAAGQIVTPAVKPVEPVSPKKKLLVPSGMAAGLLIGLVVAFILDWRRPRVYTARDMERRAGLPTVFDLTEVTSGAHVGLPPPSSHAGQVHTALAQYLASALGDGHHVLLVAEASESAGGTVAGNLASALARTRGETVLVCAFPWGVAIPRRLLGAKDGRGFAELLAGAATVAEVARRTADVPLLRVIAPGRDGADAAYDMRHDSVQRMMRELRREFRYVIIDVPPPRLDADTFSLAEFADAAVVVAPAGAASPSEVTDCVQRLERVRTATLAAVLVPPAGRPSAGRGRRGDVMDSPRDFMPEYVHAPPPEPSYRPSQSYQPQRRPPERDARAGGPSIGPWTPRSVNESWPLTKTTLTDSGWSDGEAGGADPLAGD
jgi:capsular polysaccharide biosynthesis protein